MSLHDVGKDQLDRSNPMPNVHGHLIPESVKHNQTISTAYTSNPQGVTTHLQMQNNIIKIGQTGYNTGTGLWMGLDTDSVAKLSIGDSGSHSLTWNGSILDIVGSITADSGTIGGWSISSTALTAGSGSTTVSLDSGGVNPALYAGSATPSSAPFRVTDAGVLTATNATVTGTITTTNLSATGGTIGGFTIGSSALYGSTIKTAATVDGTHNGVIMDTSGLRGYSSTLGEVFNLPTDGSAPTFASGTISSTTFNIDTSSVLKTSTNALSGVGGDAGVLINNSGIFAGSAGQSTTTANVQLKSDGTFSLYSNSSNAMTLDHGSNILLKEGGHIDFTTVSDASALTATLVATSTGNVDNGTHVYYVTFVNAGGETNPSNASSTVTVDSTHKQVSLTNIPVSSSGAVTARRIYRTKAGVTTYPCYLLTTISDNTTTTYTDNTSDASLGASNPNPSNAPLVNSSSGYLSVNGTEVLHLVDGGGLGSWLEVSVNEFNIGLSVVGSTTRDINIVPSTSSNTVQVNGDTITTNTATQTLTNKNLSSSTNTFPTPNIVQTLVNNTQFSTASTTYVDMTSASVSITTSANTSGKVLITAVCGWMNANAAGVIQYLALTDSSNNVLQSLITQWNGSSVGTDGSLQYLATGLSASTTYTYKLRCQVSTGTGYWNSPVITNGVSIIAEELL